MALGGTARAAVLDKDGRTFGELDYRAPDHIEVVLNGRDIVRISKSHFHARGEGADLKLRVRGDDVFMKKAVTTIDGIDLGRVAEVVRSPDGSFEALVVLSGGEGAPLAVPIRFVREVSAHIILEPSAEDVEGAQGAAVRSPRVRDALARAAERR